MFFSNCFVCLKIVNRLSLSNAVISYYVIVENQLMLFMFMVLDILLYADDAVLIQKTEDELQYL